MKPIPNSIAAMEPELTEWRRDFHRHPELGYEETRTAGTVAEKLRTFGLDAVETGIGGTGVVGVLHGQGGPGGPAIMLRADMDALPIHETTGAPHASTVPGKMHACGHDGHTTMLLGAARHLAETRKFRGTVYFCFQPAEEGGAGAKAMIRDGLFERFPVSRVFGMHNAPGLAPGHFALMEGPVMAASDEFFITIKGVGGHAARPNEARDPVVAGAMLVTALQTVVSRIVDPVEPAVLSITKFHAGTVSNVIPETAELGGTVRTFSETLYERICSEMDRIAVQIGAAHGVEVEIRRSPNPYPPTVNDPDATDFAEAALRDIFGDACVMRGHPRSMGGEDFSFMAREVPGCFVFIGNGDSATWHHPAYDFCDATAPAGVAYWAGLVERALPAG